MSRTLFDTVPAKALGRRQLRDTQPPSLTDVERGLHQAARLVDLYGPDYLPIFARLEREVERRRQQDDVIDRVRALAAMEA